MMAAVERCIGFEDCVLEDTMEAYKSSIGFRVTVYKLEASMLCDLSALGEVMYEAAKFRKVNGIEGCEASY